MADKKSVNAAETKSVGNSQSMKMHAMNALWTFLPPWPWPGLTPSFLCLSLFHITIVYKDNSLSSRSVTSPPPRLLAATRLDRRTKRATRDHTLFPRHSPSWESLLLPDWSDPGRQYSGQPICTKCGRIDVLGSTSSLSALFTERRRRTAPRPACGPRPTSNHHAFLGRADVRQQSA